MHCRRLASKLSLGCKPPLLTQRCCTSPCTLFPQGLLALGNVINALSEGKAHVPYRDSKLTRMLQVHREGCRKCQPAGQDARFGRLALMCCAAGWWQLRQDGRCPSTPLLHGSPHASTSPGLAGWKQPHRHDCVCLPGGCQPGGEPQHAALCQPRAQHPQQAGTRGRVGFTRFGWALGAACWPVASVHPYEQRLSPCKHWQLVYVPRCFLLRSQVVNRDPVAAQIAHMRQQMAALRAENQSLK